MKLSQIKAVEESLGKLLNQELPVKEAYRLLTLSKRIKSELTTAEDIRMNLVRKYGSTDEDGKITVSKEYISQFMEEYNELLDIELTDFPQIKININLLDGAKLSPLDIVNLDFILEEK